MPSASVSFNHRPTTTELYTGSYTVPANTYARVVCSCSASAYGFSEASNGGFSDAGASMGNTDSKTMEFWAIAGDVVDVAMSVPTSSTTTVGTTVTCIVTADVTHNTEITCRAAAIGVARAINNVNFVVLATTSGTADARFFVEEYPA